VFPPNPHQWGSKDASAPLDPLGSNSWGGIPPTPTHPLVGDWDPNAAKTILLDQ